MSNNCNHPFEYKAEPVFDRITGDITGWVYRCFDCNAIVRTTG